MALIDYKAGNLTSVKKALATIAADVFVPATPGELADAQGIIVPGVGHFGATRALDAAWTAAILSRIGEGRPLLGICLGMQWLFEGSAEAADLPGLGLLGGRCYKLGQAGPKGPALRTENGLAGPKAPALLIKVPHVGWNSLNIRRETSIVEGVPQGAQVYFTHSYVAPVTDDSVAVTEHGEPFAAIVQHGQIAGVQFHPEKSGDVGLRVLKNFLDLVR
ncbi:MAG: imidazole glycerol phosphate synthase subunit HisH [Acidobacteria bacterium]|nr:imidazole glycerol phosphate synthase subunit HisH [Acidobacteriota bacterium]